MEKLEQVQQAIVNLVNQGNYNQLPRGICFPVKVPGVLLPGFTVGKYLSMVNDQAGFCRTEYLRVFGLEYIDTVPRWFYIVKLQYYYSLIDALDKGIKLTDRFIGRVDGVLKATEPDQIKEVLKDTVWKFKEAFNELRSEDGEDKPKRVAQENIFEGMKKEDIFRFYVNCPNPEEKSKLRRMIRKLNLSVKDIDETQFKNDPAPEAPKPRSRAKGKNKKRSK